MVLVKLACTGHIVPTEGMALATVGFVKFIADIDRMNKTFHLLPFRNIFLNLAQYLMAYVAVL